MIETFNIIQLILVTLILLALLAHLSLIVYEESEPLIMYLRRRLLREYFLFSTGSPKAYKKGDIYKSGGKQFTITRIKLGVINSEVYGKRLKS